MITIAQLTAAGVSGAQAARFVDPLNAACDRFAIDTPRRVAAFIAQCKVESSNFVHLEEGLLYRNAGRILQIFPGTVKTLAQAQSLVGNGKALANTVYANKLGNGNFESGDGFRYRGRGVGQLTFKGNYAAAEAGTGRPYVSQPDLLCSPADAALSFAWFWFANRINVPADAGLIDGCTRIINKGMAAAQERRDAYKLCLKVFV